MAAHFTKLMSDLLHPCGEPKQLKRVEEEGRLHDPRLASANIAHWTNPVTP
jgi:hypothetical protein